MVFTFAIGAISAAMWTTCNPELSFEKYKLLPHLQFKTVSIFCLIQCHQLSKRKGNISSFMSLVENNETSSVQCQRRKISFTVFKLSKDYHR
jgi:hypothetical protein